ncbi:MAG: HNH endonuclease [Acidobacteriales bacterium]|nr:HNH endonuclease [Terriglobales bacterium]
MKRRVATYKYLGERTDVSDEGEISQRVRAEVLRVARKCCQMCGRSIEKHGIALVVDHKKPREWGGTHDLENLWAICEECNTGKKAYFSSIDADAEMMKKVTAHESVHVRIGELLKAVGVGNRTPSYLIDIVADQDDWHKRLRELRYPVIGWEIDTHLYKAESGKKSADYILRSSEPWPADPTRAIREFERERERKNRKARK